MPVDQQGTTLKLSRQPLSPLRTWLRLSAVRVVHQISRFTVWVSISTIQQVVSDGLEPERVISKDPVYFPVQFSVQAKS